MTERDPKDTGQDPQGRPDLEANDSWMDLVNEAEGSEDDQVAAETPEAENRQEEPAESADQTGEKDETDDSDEADGSFDPAKTQEVDPLPYEPRYRRVVWLAIAVIAVIAFGTLFLGGMSYLGSKSDDIKKSARTLFPAPAAPSDATPAAGVPDNIAQPAVQMPPAPIASERPQPVDWATETVPTHTVVVPPILPTDEAKSSGCEACGQTVPAKPTTIILDLSTCGPNGIRVEGNKVIFNCGQ